MIIRMRSARWLLRSIRLMSALLLLLSLTPSARADDTWHNVYHSLKRFFTGKSSSSPTPSHRTRRSTTRAKTEQATESPSATPEGSPVPGAEGSPEPGASPTPRVVILPAASPAAGNDQALANPPTKPDPPVKPEASPNKAPVLLSLPAPTPVPAQKLEHLRCPGLETPRPINKRSARRTMRDGSDQGDCDPITIFQIDAFTTFDHPVRDVS